MKKLRNKKAPSDTANKVPPNGKGNGYYRRPSDNAKKNAQLKRNIKTKMGTTDSEEKKTEPRKKFYQMYSWVQQMFSWVQKENVETKIDDDETLLKRLDNVFMVKHPPELLNFWRHAIKLKSENPLDAFSELDSLALVGPFLLLAAAHSERHTKNTKNGATATADEDAQHRLLLGSRFATDLPEMETLLVHRGGRFCYWRDVPEEMPNILVHVAAGGGGGEGHDLQQQHFPTRTICGERDLFAALQFVRNKLTGTGTTRTAKAKRRVKSEQKLAHLFPDNFDMSICVPDYLQMLKKRRAKESLGMPFHDIGLKVPVKNKGIGYRPLSDDAKENAQLKRNIETMGTTDNEEKKAEPWKKFYKMFSWVQLSFCSIFMFFSFSVFCCASDQTFTDKQMPLNDSTLVTTKPPFWLATDPFWRPVVMAMFYTTLVMCALLFVFGYASFILIYCLLSRMENTMSSIMRNYEQMDRTFELINADREALRPRMEELYKRLNAEETV